MGLKDTIEMMVSEDYKERFKAEYCQLEIRCAELADAIAKADAGAITACPVELLRQQLDYMVNYKGILQQRASYEGITL